MFYKESEINERWFFVLCFYFINDAKKKESEGFNSFYTGIKLFLLDCECTNTREIFGNKLIRNKTSFGDDIKTDIT